MKTTISVSDLSRALATITTVVPKSVTIPLMSHVVVDAADGKISLLGSSFDREAQSWAAAEIHEPGRLCLPADLLSGALSLFAGDKPMVIEVANEIATLTCGRSRYRVATLPPDDFPTMPEASASVSFPIAVATLRNILTTTTYAADRGKTANLNFCGVHFHVENNTLIIVALDNKRLARQEINAPSNALAMPPVTLPNEAIEDLARILTKLDGDVEMIVSPSQVALKAESFRYATRLLDGEYPAYRGVIPRLGDPSVVVDRDALLLAAQRALPVQSSLSKAAPKARFSTAPNALVLHSQGAIGGEYEEEIVAEVRKPLEPCVLRIPFLCDMLAAFPRGAKLEVHATETMKPVVFTSLDAPGALHIIMPQR